MCGCCCLLLFCFLSPNIACIYRRASVFFLHTDDSFITSHLFKSNWLSSPMFGCCCLLFRFLFSFSFSFLFSFFLSCLLVLLLFLTYCGWGKNVVVILFFENIVVSLRWDCSDADLHIPYFRELRAIKVHSASQARSMSEYALHACLPPGSSSFLISTVLYC